MADHAGFIAGECDDPLADNTTEVTTAAELCCPTTEAFTLGAVVFELLGAGITLFQLTRQFDIWEEDIDNLQDLAECYEEIGTRYKNRKLALRARDQEVYDYQNSLPEYPGPCYDRVEQASLNGFKEINEQHSRVLKALPSWACGDKCDIAYNSAKAEVQTRLHDMSAAENYEQNMVDRYHEIQIRGITRSVGGPAPNLSLAFRTTGEIAVDSLRRSTSSFNSALGAFGNIVGSLSNKYITSGLLSRAINLNDNSSVNINSSSTTVVQQGVDRSPGPVDFNTFDIPFSDINADRSIRSGIAGRRGDLFGS